MPAISIHNMAGRFPVSRNPDPQDNSEYRVPREYRDHRDHPDHLGHRDQPDHPDHPGHRGHRDQLVVHDHQFHAVSNFSRQLL